MIKLYYNPFSRATRVHWLLEELEVPYELIQVDMRAGEHKSPEYLKVHPLGKLPAITDGHLNLIESAAICMYLADKHTDKGLAPAVGSPERGLYYQWMVYAMATLEPPIAQYSAHTRFLPEEKRVPALAEEAVSSFKTAAQVLEYTLAGQQYLVGEKFSAADVLIGSMLNWGRGLGLLEGFPTLESYVKRLKERPAFQRATKR